MHKVKNAIILAAGRGSRLKHLTDNTPKPLLAPKGKTFIEDIINKLNDANISEIIVVTGYKSEQFDFLKDRVKLVKNCEWDKGNNITSLKAAIKYLGNSLIINGDIILNKNVFQKNYSSSLTYGERNENIDEWLIKVNDIGCVTNFEKNGLEKKGLYQREIIFVTKELAEFSKKYIESFNINEYQEFLFIQTAQKHNIRFSVLEIEPNQVFDLDTVEEFTKYVNS